MTRAYNFAAWQRSFAAAFAAGVPLECAPTRARGVLLLADNDEPEICPTCNGSGEGMFDGSTCRSCHGSGTATAYSDGPDWDAIRKDRIEREMMGGAL